MIVKITFTFLIKLDRYRSCNYGLGPGGYPRTIPFLALSIIYGSLLISIGRNPSQRDDWW